MSEEERDLAANSMLIKISLITGWTIPASPDVMEMLIQQLSKKMEEKYLNLNEQEVEYAFRNKGLDIKDWGKALNLAMIDEVIVPYLEDRFDLSRQEEKINGQLPKNNSEEKKEMTDEEWQEWLSDIANYEINKIPCDSYEYLVKKGEINLTNDQKHEYMARAINHYASTLDVVSKEGIAFAKMREDKIYNVQVTGSLITISKRLCVFDYFSKKKEDIKP